MKDPSQYNAESEFPGIEPEALIVQAFVSSRKRKMLF